jgi:hypothetical protein
VHVLRAAPVPRHARVLGIHPRPAVVLPPPGRLARFNGWRRDHYVADQLMRVAAIATVAALVVGGIVAGLVALAQWALGELSGVFAGAGLGAVVLLLLVLAVLPGGTGSGKPGYGFHWSRCKH